MEEPERKAQQPNHKVFLIEIFVKAGAGEDRRLSTVWSSTPGEPRLAVTGNNRGQTTDCGNTFAAG